MENLEDIKKRFFVKGNQLILRAIPSKTDDFLGVLKIIVKLFDKNRVYSEKEVNEILKTVYPDFALLRRELFDRHLLDRTIDSRSYWVHED